MTAPVIKDSTATFTPGVSERRGTTTTFSHSGLKNADAQTGVSQAVNATQQYDAFGNLASSTGTWQGQFGYGGGFGYQQDATGLKLLGHRYYDSSTGRFLTRDPIQDGRNWYVYCDSDPVGGADIEGLAKIYVGRRTVAGVGIHVFLIIVDEATNNTWTVGGGPRNHKNGSYGSITNYSGPAGDKNYEGIRKPGAIPASAILIRDDNLPGIYWYNKTASIGTEIQNKKVAYELFTTNSNTFIYTVMKRAGLEDEWYKAGRSGSISMKASTGIIPGGIDWAPGWDKVLPR